MNADGYHLLAFTPLVCMLTSQSLRHELSLILIIYILAFWHIPCKPIFKGLLTKKKNKGELYLRFVSFILCSEVSHIDQI